MYRGVHPLPALFLGLDEREDNIYGRNNIKHINA